MLNELVNSAIMGVSLAMLILIIFLRNVNSSIIIGLSIPLSIVMTLLAMSLSGITVNMMTLAGLILGLGMTLDCSIVIIESITAYREKGEKPATAGILAGEEVMSSLIAATLTTLCVFVPIILFRNQLEIIGILVQDMIFTIAISIIASLFVGILLVPVLASKWLPVHSRLQKPLSNPFMITIDSAIDKGIKKLSQLYQKLLAKTLQHRFITVLLVVCAFLGSVFALGRMDITMMPPADSDTITIEIEMPLGTRYIETKAVALEIQEFAIAEIKGIKNIITTIGDTGRVLSDAGVHTAVVKIVLDLDNSQADSEEEAKNKLRAHFANVPDASINFVTGGLMALIGSSDIDIMLRIDDLSEGMATAERIRHILATRVPEVKDIAIDLNEGLPQISVNIDRNRVYNFGLNIASVVLEISAAMNGVTPTTLRQGGKEYDVILQLAEEDRLAISDMGRIAVRSSRGMLIPVSNFADFEVSQGPSSINRENQGRVIHVTADLIDGYSLRNVESKIRNLLDEEGIQAVFAGSSEDTRDMMRAFMMVLVLALLLVFGIMAAQYESFKDPFINFCTIPLLLIGVVMVHLITGDALSSFSMIGIVLLIGIVTNNGILLVDYTNQLVRQGKSLMEACVEAGGNRFRPVLMTALTTMLGLAPMAFFPGSSSRITSPIGLVVFGGLTSATVITLIFIPVLYSLFHGSKRFP
jgi:HAE1 family hydrophobic/amphiphilic exporter-1